MSVLNKRYFHDEAAAFAEMESILWPDGPVCPHCGGMDRVYALNGVRSKPSKKHPDGVERHGLKKCGHCRKQFTVRVGTVFEDSHAPLHKWFQAIHLLCSSKKGISSHQLHRTLEVQYNTAWFMSHRIREAMRKGPLSPMGGAGKFVEVDETVIGKRDDVGSREAKYTRDRNIVLTLVNRKGEARSFHVDQANGETIVPIVRANVIAEAKIATDSAAYYGGLDVGFAGHESVNHEIEEWVRGEVTTNTVESYFALFKRGMKGVYQHCSEKHLHRYLAEFDFRYSNRSALGVEDLERAVKAVAGAKDKRLTYKAADRP
jgi:transposase-like protein